MNYVVRASPSLKLRVGPSVEAAQIGSLMNGAQVEILRRDGIWAEVKAGGWERTTIYPSPSVDPSTATAHGFRFTTLIGWCNAQWLTEIDRDPKPTPATSFALGLNALQNVPQAEEEARRGCKYFLIMNDFGGAGNLKRAHPDAVVMARRYFPQNFFLGPDQIIEGLEGAQHGPLVYVGFNEADQGDHRGDALRMRARIDVAVARKIKERNPGAVYAAGTFSVGTPDFTSAEVCQIIREEYAPHYNSGLIGFDMHLYSPNPGNIDKPTEHQWYERRWEFLFTKCGLDPNVRAIYSGEVGLDEGGIGGFAAHKSTHEYFRSWCAKYIALQSAPMIINGKSYPSPIIGGAIFQLGGNGDKRWAGYDVTGYLPVLRSFYDAKVRDLSVIAGVPIRGAAKISKGRRLVQRESKRAGKSNPIAD